MSMTWHKKAMVATYRKELITGGLVFVMLFVLSTVQLMSGEPFAWKEIELFSTPDLWNRIFWSALTFMTLGAVLYKIYFYKLLSILLGSDRKGYRQAKSIIWLGLMYVNYQIFPVVIDATNFVATILFNSFIYVVYISPLLLTGLTLGVLAGLYVERATILTLLRTKGLFAIN